MACVSSQIVFVGYANRIGWLRKSYLCLSGIVFSPARSSPDRRHCPSAASASAAFGGGGYGGVMVVVCFMVLVLVLKWWCSDVGGDHVPHLGFLSPALSQQPHRIVRQATSAHIASFIGFYISFNAF
jgi:hypothetical protein